MELNPVSGVFKSGRFEGRDYFEVAIEHPTYLVWAYENNKEDHIPRDLYEEALSMMDNEYGEEYDGDYS